MLRKTKQDKIEKQRRTFFLVGMILALGLVLAAFEYKTFDYSLSDEFTRTSIGYIDDEFVEITRHRKPEPPAPVKKPVIVIREVDNAADVEDVELFNPEADVMDSVPEFVYIPPEEDPGDEEELPFAIVEEMPEFPGGTKALYTYLASQSQYTQMAREAGIEGTVYVGFVVEKDGSVSSVELLRGIGGGLDEKVVQAVRDMPAWKPGRQRGIPVRVAMTAPFKFQLH